MQPVIRIVCLCGISLIIWIASMASDVTQPTFDSVSLGNVLECLYTKEGSLGYSLPRYRNDHYRVRYIFGKVSTVDEPNELHLLVYGPKEESGLLYEVYLRGGNGNHEIFIGDLATLKKAGGRLGIDEIPGGQGTFHRIERLLRRLYRRPAVDVMSADVKRGSASCVFLP